MLEDMVEYALKLRDSWESLEVALNEENIGVERKYKLGMISRLGLGYSWSCPFVSFAEAPELSMISSR